MASKQMGKKEEKKTNPRVPENEPKRVEEQKQPEEGIDGDVDEEEGTKEVLKELGSKDVVHGGAAAAHVLRRVSDNGDEELRKDKKNDGHEKASGCVLEEHKGWGRRKRHHV